MRYSDFLRGFCFFCITLATQAKAEEFITTKKQTAKTIPTLELASNQKRTTIEFDEQKIKGVRRVPLGSLITEQRSKLKIDLIMIRKNWKKKIINSTDWL